MITSPISFTKIWANNRKLFQFKSTSSKT